MDELIRWETPFCEAFYPAVSLFVKWDDVWGETVQAIVAPDGTESYPKFLVYFGKTQAFTSMEEAGTPRDFFGVKYPDEKLCAFEFLKSPWLKSYDGSEYFFNGPEDLKTREPFKFRHFLIFGGDNNIEVITPNTPIVEVVCETRRLDFGIEI